MFSCLADRRVAALDTAPGVSMRLPEVLRLMFHLEPNFVTTSSVPLMLHGLDHSRYPFDAFD